MASSVQPSPTRRQLEALELLAQGHAVERVGELMDPPITMGVVYRHLSRVQAKVGARSRPQMLYRAYSLGLLPAPQPSPAGPLLTARRREVLELLARDGFSISEIGDRLQVSRWTVYSHTARIYELLQASSANHAVSMAIASGDLQI